MGPSPADGSSSSSSVGRPWHYSRLELAFCLSFPALTYISGWYALYTLSKRYMAPGALEGIWPGLFGYQMDYSDRQWIIFRYNSDRLFAAAFVHLCCVNLLRFLKAPPTVLVVAELLAGLAGLAFLHGYCVLFVAAIASVNFLLSRLSAWLRVDSALWRLVPLLTWAFNVAALLSSAPLSRVYFWQLSPRLIALDQHRGFMRWSIPFNLLVLRMISFTIDHHWACAGRAKSDADAPLMRPTDPDRALQDTPRPRDRYSLLNYFAYLFYLPLYMAGPISSFNAWQAQIERPQTLYSKKDLALYALRILPSLALFEHFNHTCYTMAFCNAARRDRSMFETITPFQTIALSFASVLVLWLKFLVMWRCFRLWALLGGVSTPENMNRCVLNNYSCQQFWRSWHRSFNMWILRYMYIPLGGNQRRLLNAFIIFNFVAIWHDLDWRMLHWAWGIVFILVPETALTWLFSGPRLLGVRNSPYYRHLCTFGWSCNIMMLLFANNIGFVYGVDGLHLILGTWWQHFSLPATLWWAATVMASCNVMLYLRYGEPGKRVPY
eukprot:EG_transcript_8631